MHSHKGTSIRKDIVPIRVKARNKAVIPVPRPSLVTALLSWVVGGGEGRVTEAVRLAEERDSKSAVSFGVNTKRECFLPRPLMSISQGYRKPVSSGLCS